MANKIFLEYGRSKNDVNLENNIRVELLAEEKQILSDSVAEKIDMYNEYVSEKDASDKFRLIFTINPVCTNVLFNACTEIVYKEGSDECVVIEGNSNNISELGECGKYLEYKYGDANKRISRSDALSDTSYSSAEIAPFVYHCGADIFDNHTLKRTEFGIINKLSKDNTERADFNTLKDYIRDSDGETISEKILKVSNGRLPNRSYKRHLYTVDSVRSFRKSVNDNLIEADGWVGFLNPTSLNIPNVIYESGDTVVSSITINKCMNDNNPWEQIDMYPDRSLYSFIPKVNKYRNRLENNWDYCLTYPFENYYNEIVRNGNVEGLKCRVISNLSGTIFDNPYSGYDEDRVVYLKTQIRNTLQAGSLVSISVISNGTVSETYEPIEVAGIGYYGEDTAHVFSVNASALYDAFSEFDGGFVDENGNFKENSFEIRVRKSVTGTDCQYYFRKFRKLPNFNRADIDFSYELSEEDIKTYSDAEHSFNSTLSKVAFSENIFSDRIAEIIFSDDIITTGIKDNLGRKLSEVFLTIIKRNKGYEEWYRLKDYASADVEFSHCFGKITSGLDISPEEDNFNIHKQHNLTRAAIRAIKKPESAGFLEEDITINGNDGDNGEFLGDIVEFSPYEVKETVLEDVYHRFNTAQREFVLDSYGKINYTTVESDDFDIEYSFNVSTKSLFPGINGYVNISPEGYYYKPHYRVLLREFADTVKQGSHKRMSFAELSYRNGECEGKTSTNYYLNPGDTIILCHRYNHKTRYGKVTSVSGKLFNEITFTAPIGRNEAIEDYIIFKKNIDMPDWAYELNDGSGRYLWREIMSERDFLNGDELFNSTFTNGAHYFYKGINFYLRRQDPTGEYGLNGSSIDNLTGASNGQIKDVSVAEYVEVDKGVSIC